MRSKAMEGQRVMRLERKVIYAVDSDGIANELYTLISYLP
jgi:hypothetical protein